MAHTMRCPTAGRLLGRAIELSVPWRTRDTGGRMAEKPAPRKVALRLSVLSFRDCGGGAGGGTSRCLRLARLACQSAGGAGEDWGRASDMALKGG